MKYEIKTQLFSGPLEKLLELIEEKKLDITQVCLAEVTGDFLNYVKQIGSEAGALILADFLVVAAKLVLIKSKILLPNLELTSDEESDIKDLESRLKIYREYKIAGQHLQALWNGNKKAYARELFLNLGDAKIFYPPTGLSASHLVKAVSNLVTLLQRFVPETQKIKSAVITIEQKIKELLERFTKSASHSFSALTQQRPKTEIIVLFLAVLHLLKDRIINVEQNERFGDIIIQKSK